MAKRRRKIPTTAQEYADEAIRYYRNARKVLRSIPVRDDAYQDVKPVREACGTAYLAVLAAIRSYLLAQGRQPSRLPESYEAYGQALARHTARDGKVKKEFARAYVSLHLDGYYRGFQDTEFGKLAFQHARFLIERLTGRRMNGA